jgi:hypothetical protein
MSPSKLSAVLFVSTIVGVVRCARDTHTWYTGIQYIQITAMYCTYSVSVNRP